MSSEQRQTIITTCVDGVHQVDPNTFQPSSGQGTRVASGLQRGSKYFGLYGMLVSVATQHEISEPRPCREGGEARGQNMFW